MNQIDSTSIFLVMVFILPGFFSLKIYSFFYEKKNNSSDLEITYQSLLCSLIIYGLFYAIIKGNGQSLTKYTEANPWATIFLVMGLGCFLGIIMYIANIAPLLILKIPYIKDKLGSLQVVELPDIYSAIFESKFYQSNEPGYWIIWHQNNQIWEGWVDLVECKDSDVLLYIKEIREINEENEVIKEYPKDYGMLVSVNNIKGFEIMK